MAWTVFLLLHGKFFSQSPWNCQVFSALSLELTLFPSFFPVCSIWVFLVSFSRPYLKIWVSLSFLILLIAPQWNPRIWRNKMFYWLQTIISEAKTPDLASDSNFQTFIESQCFNYANKPSKLSMFTQVLLTFYKLIRWLPLSICGALASHVMTSDVLKLNSERRVPLHLSLLPSTKAPKPVKMKVKK